MDMDIRIPIGLLFAILGFILLAFGLYSANDTELYASGHAISISLTSLYLLFENSLVGNILLSEMTVQSILIMDISLLGSATRLFNQFLWLGVANQFLFGDIFNCKWCR